MTISYRNILLTGLLVKIFLALYLPLTLDEYYYLLWGKNFSLSYFDHPPMVGWMMTLSAGLAPYLEGLARWPFIFLSHGTLLIWWFILKDEVSEKVQKVFLLTALLNPLWGTGSLIATPDIPLVFFWSLSLLCVKHTLAQPNIKNYCLLGLALGFGFLAKYQIVLFVPSLLLLIGTQKKWRMLFTPKVIASVVVGLVACLPVLLWNYQNDWASFEFQWKHGMGGTRWNWKYPLDYTFSQIFLIFPTFLIFLWVKPRRYLNHWLLPFAAFPFVFFFYSSFKSRVEGNWAIMAFPAIYAIAHIYTSDKFNHWLQKTQKLWAVLIIIAVALLPFSHVFPRHEIKLFESDRYTELIDYHKNQDLPVRPYNYQLASLLSFESGEMVCKLPLYGRVDHFNFFNKCKELPERFIYLTENHFNGDLEKDLPGYKIIGTKKINQNFQAIEVLKR